MPLEHRCQCAIGHPEITAIGGRHAVVLILYRRLVAPHVFYVYFNLQSRSWFQVEACVKIGSFSCQCRVYYRVVHHKPSVLQCLFKIALLRYAEWEVESRCHCLFKDALSEEFSSVLKAGYCYGTALFVRHLQAAYQHKEACNACCSEFPRRLGIRVYGLYINFYLVDILVPFYYNGVFVALLISQF